MLLLLKITDMAGIDNHGLSLTTLDLLTWLNEENAPLPIGSE